MTRKSLTVKEVLEAISQGKRIQQPIGHFEYIGGSYDPYADPPQEKIYVHTGYSEIEPSKALKHLASISEGRIGLERDSEYYLFEPNKSYLLTIRYNDKNYISFINGISIQENVISFAKKIGCNKPFVDIDWNVQEVILEKDL